MSIGRFVLFHDLFFLISTFYRPFLVQWDDSEVLELAPELQDRVHRVWTGDRHFSISSGDDHV